MDDGHGADELVAAFARWAADQRVSTAAAERARERSLRQQAGAGATLIGILVDLAEQATPVTVSVAGVRRSGRLVGAGDEFCVLDAAAGRPSLVVTSAIGAVWPARGSVQAAGGRLPAVSLSWAAALSVLAEERTPVRLILAPDHEVTGDLFSVGDDVVTVAAHGSTQRLAHVGIAAIGVCDLL